MRRGVLVGAAARRTGETAAGRITIVHRAAAAAAERLDVQVAREQEGGCTLAALVAVGSVNRAACADLERDRGAGRYERLLADVDHAAAAAAAADLVAASAAAAHDQRLLEGEVALRRERHRAGRERVDLGVAERRRGRNRRGRGEVVVAERELLPGRREVERTVHRERRPRAAVGVGGGVGEAGPRAERIAGRRRVGDARGGAHLQPHLDRRGRRAAVHGDEAGAVRHRHRVLRLHHPGVVGVALGQLQPRVGEARAVDRAVVGALAVGEDALVDSDRVEVERGVALAEPGADVHEVRGRPRRVRGGVVGEAEALVV